MQPLTDTLLNAIRAIAQEAGEHLKAFYQQSLAPHLKADNTPVTEADLFLSRFISEKLQALTPNVPILSEEQCDIPLAERRHWQEYWIIDPLDGTQQFLDKTDQFSVVIGLVQANRPVLGVIHAPILDKTYFAKQDGGAFLQENQQIRPLVAASQNLPKTLTITVGSTICEEQVCRFLNEPYQAQFLTYGSSSLKAGLVAEGKADCYIRLGDTGEWDTAVAEVLLREVGGKIFDFHFQPLTYNQRETWINPNFVMVGANFISEQKVFSFE